MTVSRVGLGKDIWNVHPDDITDFLYVSPISLHHIHLTDPRSAILLGRASLPWSPTRHEDLYSPLLSQSLPWQEYPTGMLDLHRSERRILHHV